MRVVYVSIGNSDDKLTQAEWSRFYASTDRAIRGDAQAVYGAWTSDSVSSWQNACWAVEVASDSVLVEHLKMILSKIATDFKQDSIAWAEVSATEFLSGERQ